MTKVLTASTTAKSLELSGIEPLVVIQIDWGGTVGTRYYGGDTFLIDAISVEGILIDVSSMQQQISANNAGSVTSISVSLDDSDQSLRQQIKETILNGKEATVYHLFRGLDEDDLVVLMKGVVSGQVVWSDQDRTLGFDIVSVIESEEVGHSTEAGAIPNLASSAIGRAWPVVFGCPVDVISLKLLVPVRGQLIEDWVYNDTEIFVDPGEDFPQATEIIIRAGNVYARGSFSGRTFTIVEENVLKFPSVITAARVVGDPDEQRADVIWIADATKRVVGTWMFLEGDPGSGFEQKGQAHWCVQQEGDKCWLQTSFTNDLGNKRLIEAGEDLESSPIKKEGWKIGDDENGLKDVRFVVRAGSSVVQSPNDEIVYVANLGASDSIKRVSARREISVGDLGEQLIDVVPVPTEYYTINLSDTIDGQTCTTVSFDTPLRDRGQGWTDEIYCSVESQRSENVADVIEFLLTNFTNLQIDTATFAEVNAKVEKYPAHFAITDKTDALTISSEIAYLARCSLFNIGDKAYLRYLSELPTFGDGDIRIEDRDILEESGSSLITTQLEDLVTELQAVWRDSGAVVMEDGDDTHQFEIVETNNVSQFGRKVQQRDWFIYQHEELVQKSADFWIGRTSRVWTLFDFDVFLNALPLDLMDTMLIDSELMPVDSILAFVQNVNHLPDGESINILAWLPVEAGTSVFATDAYQDDTADVKPSPPCDDVDEGVTEVEQAPFQILLQTFSGTLDGEADISLEHDFQFSHVINAIVVSQLLVKVKVDQGSGLFTVVRTDVDGIIELGDTIPDVKLAPSISSDPAIDTGPYFTIRDNITKELVMITGGGGGGVPDGGLKKQVLAKNSNTDQDFDWDYLRLH